MALLLTQADLRPLVEEATTLEEGFRAIEGAILQHKRGEAGLVAWLQLPLTDDGRGVIVDSSSEAAGMTLRVFPWREPLKIPSTDTS